METSKSGAAGDIAGGKAVAMGQPRYENARRETSTGHL